MLLHTVSATTESMTNTTPINEQPSFESLQLSKPLCQVIKQLGYKTPSPIQLECIPKLIKGEDVLGMAQTGSGKTAAFLLPALENLDWSQKNVQVLVLAPTRELALQVSEAANVYATALPQLKVAALYGGQRYDVQLRTLRSFPQIVVGTPGRLLDHLKQGTLDLSKVKLLVLDEADEMLRMGFLEDVETILSALPKTRQTALFSATMPPAIRRITKRFMHNPVEIQVASTQRTAPNIEQTYWIGRSEAKPEALGRFLEVEPFTAAIVFVRTKAISIELAEMLEKQGFACAAINGDMTQALREQTLDRFRQGKTKILLATDVAARGLDVKEVGLVINYDIPLDVEAYVHRIGRTGRAGRSGKALILISPKEMRLLRNVERTLKVTIGSIAIPTNEAVVQARLSRLQTQLQESLASEKLPLYEQLVERLDLDLKTGAQSLAAALLMTLSRAKPLDLPEHLPVYLRSSVAREKPVSAPFKSGYQKESYFGSNQASGSRAPYPSFGDRNAAPMKTFQMMLGRADGVEVKHIVGALLNEGRLKRGQIGSIKLSDASTMVELSQRLPRHVLQQLSEIKIFNKPMRLKATSAAV